MKKLLILLIIPLCYSACREVSKPESKNNTVNVRVHKADYIEYSVPVYASGILTTKKEMKLSFKTAGLISSINVREGEFVTKGQTLARLDLSEIRAQQKLAEITLDKAKRDFERAGNLYRDSVTTLEQYQDAQSALDLAASRKQIADFNYKYSIIEAPATGKILKILGETHEIVSAGYPVVIFAGTENNWIVEVPLSDKDIVKLNQGDTANIRMDAFPGKEWKSVVSELSALADPVTGTYTAELNLQEVNSKFRTGFIARAEIIPSPVVRSLWLPLDALTDINDNQAWVYVLNQDKAVKRRIQTGILIKNGTSIIKGLDQGELVVTDGVSYIRPDSRITVKED